MHTFGKKTHFGEDGRWMTWEAYIEKVGKVVAAARLEHKTLITRINKHIPPGAVEHPFNLEVAAVDDVFGWENST